MVEDVDGDGDGDGDGDRLGVGEVTGRVCVAVGGGAMRVAEVVACLVRLVDAAGADRVRATSDWLALVGLALPS